MRLPCPSSPPRWAFRLAAVLMAALVAWGVAAAEARADGDPASDVLVQTPPVFIPAASSISYGQEAALARQLHAAATRGAPLRVAVIPDRAALGSVGALWRQPERYAVFLGGELSLNYHGELLVVMPNGFGVARAGRPVQTSLARLAPRGGQLFTATEQAVARLTGSVARGPVAATRAPSRVSGIGWWVVTVLALLAIALAWALSLRARPPARVTRRAAHQVATPGNDRRLRGGSR